MFQRLQEPAPDPILALGGLFHGDPRPHKIDLGIGVYRNESGVTPILRCVRVAVERLLVERTSKSYIGPCGEIAFAAAMRELIFGDLVATIPAIRDQPARAAPSERA